MNKVRKTYTVRAERSGSWWAISIDGLAGAFSQAKRLDQVEEVARDLIAIMADTPLNSFDVEIVPKIDAAADSLVALTKMAKVAAAQANLEAAQAMINASTELLSKGLPTRDVGQLLGVSFQRVAQVASTRKAGRDPKGLKRVG